MKDFEIIATDGKKYIIKAETAEEAAEHFKDMTEGTLKIILITEA